MSEFSNPAGNAAADAQRYIASLLAVLGDRDPLAVMAELPDALDTMMSGLDDDLLRLPERPGKWSIIEVVGHLTDTELVYGYRTAMILAHDAPEIPGYDQEAWVRVLNHRAADVSELLRRLRLMRTGNMEVYRSLSDEQLARHGRHAERGHESIAQTIRLLGAHDLVHRRQIERIMAGHKG